MNNLDPFLTGLAAGVAVGFAGLFRPLLSVAVLVAAGYLAWAALEQGPEGAQAAVESVLNGFLAPHARLAVGAVLGALFGESLGRIPAFRR